jgi:protein SCO1/2
VQFNNFVAALNGLGIKPNDDFQVVSISLDPTEKPSQAMATKRKYLANYGDLDTAEGWHFLVGSQPVIEQAAAACGITYVYVAEQNFYSHPSALIFCSPSGKIVRYLNGLDGELDTKLKPAIIEASEGRVGSVVDRALYFAGCYMWDPSSGKYTPVAMRIMRLGGVLTIAALVIGVVPFWFRRSRLRSADSGPSPVELPPADHSVEG